MDVFLKVMLGLSAAKPSVDDSLKVQAPAFEYSAAVFTEAPAALNFAPPTEFIKVRMCGPDKCYSKKLT